MKITITIVNSNTNRAFDIQVDNGQRIATTLRVMSENLNGMGEVLADNIVRVADSGRILRTENTYEENKIYSGAKIIIM